MCLTLLLMEMWWEGIRVRDRLAVQHDSVLFFQAVWSKIQRACQRKMGKREKWGRKRGRRKDGETGEEVIQDCSELRVHLRCCRWCFWSLKVRHEKKLHGFHKMTFLAWVVSLYFGACWWFWEFQPPADCISASGHNMFYAPDVMTITYEDTDQ